MNSAERKPNDSRSVRKDIEFCLDNMRHINSWEFEFLTGIAGVYESLTKKQAAKLATIIFKVKTARRYRKGQR